MLLEIKEKSGLGLVLIDLERLLLGVAACETVWVTASLF
jgi:hypothetical protein